MKKNKKIYWSKLSEEDRLKEMRRIAKEEACENGVFYTEKSHRLYKAIGHYGVSIDVLLEGTGLRRTEAAVRTGYDWKNMSQEQRIETLVEIAKERAEDGILGSGLEYRDTMRLYRINKYDIFKKAGLVCKNDVKKLRDKKALELLREKALEHTQQRITDIQTLAEWIATTLFNKDSPVDLFEFAKQMNHQGLRVREALFTHVAELLIYTDTPLEKLTLSELDKILKNVTINTHQRYIEMAHRIIKNLLFGEAAKNGLYVPAMLEFNQGAYVQKFIAIERKRIKKPITVYEHSIMIFPQKLPYMADIILSLKEYASVKSKHFVIDLLSHYKKNVFSKASRSDFNRTLIKNILLPLQEAGIEYAKPIKKTFNKKARLTEEYIKHVKNKDGVKKEDRTVGWYVFETTKVTLKSHSTTMSNIFVAYGEYLNIKAKELASFHLEELRNRPKTFMLNAVLHAIIEDGFYKHEGLVSNFDELIDEFDFNEDVWHYGKKSSIDFSVFDETFQKPIKHYAKHMIKGGKDKSMRKANISEVIDILRSVGLFSFSDLNSDIEMRFYMTLGDTITDDASTRKASTLLDYFRHFIGVLQKLKLDLVSESFVLNYDFKIKTPPPKIVVYSDEEMEKIVKFLKSDESITNEFMTRLELCAFGLQTLTARRLGEITNEAEGLKTDAFSEWGSSGEVTLKYYSPKHGKHEQVLLSDLIGERKDPFAKVLEELSMKLFKEAIEITSHYRHALPVTLKEYVFVIHEARIDSNRLYKKLGSAYFYSKIKRLYFHLRIKQPKSSHTSRHTLATAIILSGGTIMDAADALQDQAKTVSRHYHQFTSQTDTLKHFAEKGRTSMVDALRDSEHFHHLEKKEHRVLLPEEMSPNGHKMAGGSCLESNENIIKCPSYQMIRGAKGCSGCRHLEVNAQDNKGYWQKEVEATFEAMEATAPGSIAYQWEDSNNRRARNVLDDIEQKELEHEFF